MSWWTRLFRRDRLDRDLDRELQFHIDSRVQDLVRGGADPAEARRRALAEFGGMTPIRETTREARGLRWLEDLGADVRYAVRMMRRSPGFALAAILSLGLGIGANAAVFSVLDAIVLRQLPVKSPSELVVLSRVGLDEDESRFSWPLYGLLRDATPGRQLAAMTPVTRMQTVGTDGTATLIAGQLVSGNWFSLLGVTPMQGRVFVDDDTRTINAPAAAVISEGFWQRQFGGAPDVVGRSLVVNGLPVTVIGVAGAGFSGTQVGVPVDVWLPVTLQDPLRYRGNASMDNADDEKPWLPQAEVSWLTTVGRQRRDAADLQAQLDVVFRQQLEARAATIQNAERRAFVLRQHLRLDPAGRGLSDTREQFSGALWMLWVTVALVLLVACANLANLLMARSAARGQEFAVRLSVGAGRGRLVRQLLAESLLLSLIGGIVGIALARAGGVALVRLAESRTTTVPYELPLDWRLLGFALLASVLTGVLFGLLPALRVARTDPFDALRTAGRTVGDAGRHGALPFGRVLVVAQVAVSLVLLVAGIVFVASFRNLLALDPGFAREQLVAARFDPIMAGYLPAQFPALFERLSTEAGRVPGARAVALALTGLTSGSARTSGVQIKGRQSAIGTNDVSRMDTVSANYFEATGMHIVRGRGFTDRDRTGAPAVAVVNEAFVRKFLTGEPIGSRFDTGSGNFEIEVVGVVADTRLDGPRRSIPPMAYLPMLQQPDEALRMLYVRVTGDPAALQTAVRRAIAAADPNLAVREVVTLRELTERTVASERLISRLSSVFGAIAVLVATLGLYGTVSYSVARRTRELGVRLALGASPAGIRWLVLRETLQLVVLGAVVGLALAWPALGALRSFVFGLSARDPWLLTLATATLLAIGAMAGAVPAWRASRVDPTTALRGE